MVHNTENICFGQLSLKVLVERVSRLVCVTIYLCCEVVRKEELHFRTAETKVMEPICELLEEGRGR